MTVIRPRITHTTLDRCCRALIAVKGYDGNKTSYYTHCAWPALQRFLPLKIMTVLKLRIIHLKTPHYTPCAIDLSATQRASNQLEMFGDYMYLVDEFTVNESWPALRRLLPSKIMTVSACVKAFRNKIFCYVESVKKWGTYGSILGIN